MSTRAPISLPTAPSPTSPIPWPVHCVAGTDGAAFHPDLDVALDEVFLKGRTTASYTGFDGGAVADESILLGAGWQSVTSTRSTSSVWHRPLRSSHRTRRHDGRAGDNGAARALRRRGARLHRGRRRGDDRGGHHADRRLRPGQTFFTRSPVRMVPGSTTTAFMPRSLRFIPSSELTPAEGVEPEPARELGTSPMGLGGDLDDGAADSQSRARGDVVPTQIEVDVELVAGRGPAVDGPDDRFEHA